MVKRAGCAGTDCTCHISGGPGIHVYGLGTPGSPFVIESSGQPALLRGEATTAVAVSVAGDGRAATPYSVSAVMSVNTGLASAKAQRYTANDVWVKPPGVSLVLVTLIGAGGGGAAGAGQTVGSPGPGGGGGGWTQALFHASWLPATVPLIVGQGGSSGAGVASSATGAPGVRGGDTAFGPYLLAGGGAGGIWDSTASNELPIRSVGVESGGPTYKHVLQAGGSTYKAGGGGGDGGEYRSMDPTIMYGGDVQSYVPVSAIVPPTPAGSNPGPSAPPGTGAAGGGGQGGWGYNPVQVTPPHPAYAAQSGMAGGYPGGGGGGGGVGASGPLPGSGGRGADGWIEIVSW